jgi:hypothetical protein
MVSLLVLLLLLLVEPFESRKLAKTGKVEVLDLTDPTEELPQDESDEDRILPDETDPCLTTAIAYTSPDDNFFDPDLMQFVMLDVSAAIQNQVAHVLNSCVH